VARHDLSELVRSVDRTAQITPFGMLYAIHDALVRPYPGYKMGPSLAQLWEESEDGLTYQFKLRPGLRFHNGDPLTTEDVQFSSERYQGAGAQALKAHVREVEIVDPLVVRFHLKELWPDFMTFYGTTATAAGIVMRFDLQRIVHAPRHDHPRRRAEAEAAHTITDVWMSRLPSCEDMEIKE
jgi:ABC-type transport system substrate-binding protein